MFAAVVGLLVFDALRILGSFALKQDAMGRGDAKLAALIGAWLGWKLMLLSAFFACLLGSIIGIGGIVLGLIGRRQAIPFGPEPAGTSARISIKMDGNLPHKLMNSLIPTGEPGYKIETSHRIETSQSRHRGGTFLQK